MNHTLAVGKTAANKYPSLGQAAGNSQYPLGKMFGLLVGESGAGKSFVMQSNPDAYILNLDETPTVYPNSEATMFPIAGPDGRPVDETGKPIVLSWEDIEEKKKVLCALATSNSPRPQTVVLDTIMQALRLLRPYVAKMYGRENFRDVDGRLGWERLFDTLIEFAVTLRRHGYGVVFTCHLSRITISGKKVKRKIKTSEKIRKHIAAFENEKLQGITKTRTLSSLTQVTIPRKNAWGALEAAFEKANQVH